MATKSSVIRDVESRYGINLSTCYRSELDALTSKSSKTRRIKSLKDIMNTARKFDVENMTDVERANLKYLVMSTEEVLDTLQRKVKSIYYKPQEARLRFLMSYEDFYQICAYKLLLNDGILRFDANYKFDPAIHCWVFRTAMWQTHRKVTVADEVCILDQPFDSESSKTLADYMLKPCYQNSRDFDHEALVQKVLDRMDRTTSPNIVARGTKTEVPVSDYVIAKLILEDGFSKRDISKILFNKHTNEQASNMALNKFYKRVLQAIKDVVDEDSKSNTSVSSISITD